jgi:YVTN family beta-propeller protein
MNARYGSVEDVLRPQGVSRLFGLLAAAACTAVLPGLAAANTGAILNKSGPIQITRDGSTVWLVNRHHGSVSRLATAGNVVTQFALPGGAANSPTGLDIAQNGEVWVAARDTDRVFVLDPVTGAVTATIVLPAGSGPTGVAASGSGDRVWVTLNRSNGVVVFDAATHAEVATVRDVPRRPYGLSFASNGADVWVTHDINEGEDSFVSRIDAATLKLTNTVILKSVNPKSPADIPNDAVKVPEGGYMLPRGQAAQAPNSGFLWLPVQHQNFHNALFTPDSTVQSAVMKIDLAARAPGPATTRVVLTAVYAHNGNALVGNGWNAHVAGPVDLAFDVGGQTAYLVHEQSNDVVVMPTNTTMNRPEGAQALTEIPVGDMPIGIAASPASNKLYVLNMLSRDVSVINMDTRVEEARVPATPGTPEPLAADVLRGAKLFNTSADLRLSSSAKVACASCHPGGETDGLAWSFGQFGAGTRKAFSLLETTLSFGAPVGGRGQMHRSGDRDEVQDFDFTARAGIMGGTGFLATPNPALGAPNAGRDADLDAIAAYLFSLAPKGKSPAREAGGGLTEAALRGGAIFKVTQTSHPLYVGCINCHTPPKFTDGRFWDVGGLRQAPENEGPAFNTPTLVGQWDFPPHNQGMGVFAESTTLWGPVKDATGNHGDTRRLNRTQARDLEAFLTSIDGTMAAEGIGAVGDVDRPRVVAVRPVSLGAVDVIFSETVDAASATSLANYALSTRGRAIAPTAAVLDAAWGNRVRLTVPLEYDGCAVAYTLVPGPIADVAGQLPGGTANVLDVNDPGNRVGFVIDGSITVTFGDSGLETFGSVARDAGFQSSLSNVSHARWRLYPTASPEMKGFLAFDFAPTLQNVCGVTDPARILDASFTVSPEFGQAAAIELRRCLMPWGDPPNDWCFGCANAVTVNHAKHNTVAWHQSGARARGGAGTSVSEYYPSGQFDTALAVDATSVMAGVNEPLGFAGAAVTGAFRFWLANPTLNFGYAAEVVGTAGAGTEFSSEEEYDGRRGPVLSITFGVEPRAEFEDCNGNGTADSCDIAGGGSFDRDGNGVPDECDCPADFNRNGSVDFFDYLDFVAAFDGNDPRADFDRSGTIDFFDYLDFVMAFDAGC